MRRAAAISYSVSRSSNPLSAAYRGVAQLFLTSMSASLADQRRTDKTSIPDWANHLPGHPAPFVRFVRTVGSPQSCSGARYRRSTISGRFSGRNLVVLGPQSKCFFLYLTCAPLISPAPDHDPDDALKIVSRRDRLDPYGGEDRCHGAELALSQFEAQDAVGREQAADIGRNRTIPIKPVRPAVERAARIEVAYFGLQF